MRNRNSTSGEGIALILQNEAMPGYLRVDLTFQDCVADHIHQLNASPIPLPFEVQFAAKVPNLAKLEKALQLVFSSNRIGRNGDFLEIEPELPRAIIELVAIEDFALSDDDLEIGPQERQRIDRLRSSRSARKDGNAAATSTRRMEPASPVICVQPG